MPGRLLEEPHHRHLISGNKPARFLLEARVVTKPSGITGELLNQKPIGDESGCDSLRGITAAIPHRVRNTRCVEAQLRKEVNSRCPHELAEIFKLLNRGPPFEMGGG